MRTVNLVGGVSLKKSYFIWIFLYSLVWLAGMGEYISDHRDGFWRLLGLSGFYVIFFVLPLCKERQRLLTLLFNTQVILAIVTVYPIHGETFNPYILLIFAIQAAEIAQRLTSLSYGAFPAILQAAGMIALVMAANSPVRTMIFTSLFMVLLFAGAAVYLAAYQRGHSALARYDALLTEYRGLKRRALSEEELARQEERVLIGHEIHDSVGHKLTALLMQLEAYRLKAGEQNQTQVQLLKKLAQDSLDETRRAVRSYKHGEPGGLQGIMRLIRNLESSSFLRVHFTVNHGAFSAPLSGEQSFVIYRSVQEAMTNIMKHTKAREATVMFEAPGGSLFRFEVSNPIPGQRSFTEGYGLRSMRERLRGIGGDLDVFTTVDQFVVRGWLLMRERGEHID